MAARPPSVSRALASATKATQLGPGDAATLALARHYAALIDRAADVARDADALLVAAAAEGGALAERVAKLRAEVDVRAVTSDVGPKMLAALAALGMTPAARAGVVKGGSDVRPGSALDELRSRRARQRDAAAVDPASS
jgi:hypothetical protein